MTQKKVSKQEKLRKVEGLVKDYPEIILRRISDSEELKRVFVKTILNGSEELKEHLYDEFFEKGLQQRSVAKPAIDEETIVTEYLNSLGMPRHLLGFKYSREALCMCLTDSNLVYAMTKGLYPELAKKFDTTPSRVERAIRHAIETTWERGQKELIEKTFGYTVSATKGKPTNSEFIAMISDEIRKKIK